MEAQPSSDLMPVYRKLPWTRRFLSVKEKYFVSACKYCRGIEQVPLTKQVLPFKFTIHH